jgi:pilus assembly protein CpaC
MKIRNLFLFVFYLFISFSLNALAFELPHPPQLVTLSVGQQIVLSREQFEQVSIANPQIAQAQMTPSQKQILITTLNPGNTDLILWDRKGIKMIYPLRVIGGSLQDHVKEIETLLLAFEGIRARRIGAQIILEGFALRPNDLKKINQIASLYPNTSNLVELAEEVRPILAEEMNRKLKDLGFDNISAQIIGRDIYLRGDALDEVQKQHALQLAFEYYPDIKDMIQIANHSQPSIELQLSLIEINRSQLKALGIRWQEALLAVGEMELSTNGSSFGLSSNPTAAIDLIQKKGWGRILTQPKLLCRSGEKAEFHAGGEIPIRLISERTADIIFKPYGILLKMSPVVTQEQNISLKIDTEISTVDGGNSVEGIPAFLTRKLTTSTTLPSGESLILAGLMDHNDLKAVSKIPLLGHIPLLGELFKSRSFRNGVSELLIFIEPKIINPPNLAVRTEIKNFKTSYQDKEKWFRPQLND